MAPGAQEASESAPSDDEPTLADYLLSLFRLLYDPTEGLRVLFLAAWPGLLFSLLIAFSTLPVILISLSESLELQRQLFLIVQRVFPISPELFLQVTSLFGGTVFLGAVLFFGIVQYILLRVSRNTIAFVDSLATLCYALTPAFTVSVFRWLLLALFEHLQAHVGTSPLFFLVSDLLVVLALLAALYALFIWNHSLQLLTNLSVRKTTLLISLVLATGFAPLAGLSIAQSYRALSPKESTRNLDYIFDSLELKLKREQ